MMYGRILVLGGTGMLGRPVVHCLTDKGHTVRVLTRNVEKTKNMFGDTVEIFEGSATNRDDIREALVGCEAVHLNLSPATEYTAMEHVVDLAEGQVERISYVSATTLSEENRWFDRVDVKMRTEELLRNSGIQHVIFCPTWVMETLQNFINGNWAVVVLGNNPPALHFFAAADFGRMVAASYNLVLYSKSMAMVSPVSRKNMVISNMAVFLSKGVTVKVAWTTVRMMTRATAVRSTASDLDTRHSPREQLRRHGRR